MLAMAWLGIGVAMLLVAWCLSAVAHAKSDDQRRTRFLVFLMVLGLVPTLTLASSAALDCATKGPGCSGWLFILWGSLLFAPASAIALVVATGVYLLPLRPPVRAVLLGIVAIALTSTIVVVLVNDGPSFRT